ncbi:MAG: hypothetical protein LBK26_02590 [Rickettsiales bacterium]|jgi:hypothetical protein|nr:hypothetical protein [Rickettsiales bacterium]
MNRKKLDFGERFKHYSTWTAEYRQETGIIKLDALIKSLPGGNDKLPDTVEELLQRQNGVGEYFANAGNLDLQECILVIKGKQN